MKYPNIMSKQHRTAANNLPAGDVFHPGAFLSEEMEARGLKQVELAKELGLSKTEINLVVHGKRGITVPLAIKLEKVLGVSAETWMSLQMKFDIDLEKKKNNEELKAKEDRIPEKALLGETIAYA
jgi:HTH-type transcriptional regulator/antitoxin HigA